MWLLRANLLYTLLTIDYWLFLYFPPNHHNTTQMEHYMNSSCVVPYICALVLVRLWVCLYVTCFRPSLLVHSPCLHAALLCLTTNPTSPTKSMPPIMNQTVLWMIELWCARRRVIWITRQRSSEVSLLLSLFLFYGLIYFSNSQTYLLGLPFAAATSIGATAICFFICM